MGPCARVLVVEGVGIEDVRRATLEVAAAAVYEGRAGARCLSKAHVVCKRVADHQEVSRSHPPSLGNQVECGGIRLGRNGRVVAADGWLKWLQPSGLPERSVEMIHRLVRVPEEAAIHGA